MPTADKNLRIPFYVTVPFYANFPYINKFAILFSNHSYYLFDLIILFNCTLKCIPLFFNESIDFVNSSTHKFKM